MHCAGRVYGECKHIFYVGNVSIYYNDFVGGGFLCGGPVCEVFELFTKNKKYELFLFKCHKLILTKNVL